MTLPPQEPARQDANPMARRPREEKRETAQVPPAQPEMASTASVQSEEVPTGPSQPVMPETQPVMPETQPVTDFSMEDDGFAEFTIE
jgi:hypothetical protein